MLQFVPENHRPEETVDRIIYIIGAVVVVLAVLAFFGLR